MTERTDQQLASMIRSVRATQFVLVLSLTANLLILTTGASVSDKQPPRPVVASSITISRPGGSPALTLTADDRGGAINFLDRTGSSRLKLELDKNEQPVAIFTDKAGSDRLVLSLEPYPSILMLDKQQRQQLYLVGDEEPYLQLHDATGRLRSKLGASRNHGYVQLLSPEEKQRVNISSGSSAGVMAFCGDDEVVRMMLGMFPMQEVGVRLFDPGERVRAQFTQILNGKPLLRFLDREGNPLPDR